MRALAELFDVLPDLFPALRKLYPEHFKPQKTERRLSADLLHELAPLNKKAPEPGKSSPLTKRRWWIHPDDRNRNRRPSTKK